MVFGAYHCEEKDPKGENGNVSGAWFVEEDESGAKGAGDSDGDDGDVKGETFSKKGTEAEGHGENKNLFNAHLPSALSGVDPVIFFKADFTGLTL